MKLAIIAFSDKLADRLKIRDELVRRGHVCDLLHFPILPIDDNVIEHLVVLLSQYDVVHFVLGFNEELSKILQTRLLEKGVICPNQRIKTANLNDKIVQMVILAKSGVPIPRSVRLIYPDKEDISKILGFPFVLKEPVGSKGEQVTLCTEENFGKVIKKNKEYLGQKFINYTADYRVHVAGEKTFCIYERIAPAGDFRANVSLGGAMKKVEDQKLLTDLSKLALRATRALSMDYGGIDIIRDEEGNFFVLEFNPNPGFKNVTITTGLPFFEPIASYYESLL